MNSYNHSNIKMEYLFDEILIEVFGYLNLQTLKNCRLVCERWDELIRKNKRFLNNHQLVLRRSKDSVKFSDIRIKPKYAVFLDDQGLRMNVFNHLHDVYSLKIDLRPCEAYLNHSQFAELLNAVPNLKVLHISNINFNEPIPNEGFEKIKMNLVELNCSSELINVLECSKLKILNLRWRWNFPEQRNANVCKFLSQLNELESLTLNRPSDFFDYFENFNYKFRLKSFTFLSSANFRDYGSFIRFLEPHKHSLLSLDIQMYSFEQSKFAIEEILKFIMRNLWYLQELDLDTVFKGTAKKIELLPLQLSGNETNTINRFGFNDIFYSLDDNKQLIDMLPKLKHLSIKACFCKVVELLEHVAIKPHLESLKVFNFDCVDSTVKFANLKEFTVHTFSTSCQAFNTFITRNSKTLEILNIGDATNICLQTANSISKCENLKYLTIDVSNNKLTSTMKIFNAISLRSRPITVIFKDYPSIVRFNIPEDKIFWDEQKKIV